jgi:hypothetical protein
LLPSATTERSSESWQAIHLVEHPVDGQLHLEVAGSGIITGGASVRVGEVVTVSFVIRNEFAYPVEVKRLRAGGRLDHSCTEENAKKWSGLPAEFPAVANLLLQPGEEYQYRTSRQYFRPGTYFIEPVRQDDRGSWGGFSPSACLDLLVSP